MDGMDSTSEANRRVTVLLKMKESVDALSNTTAEASSTNNDSHPN
jgi:hypothetical protein